MSTFLNIDNHISMLINPKSHKNYMSYIVVDKLGYCSKKVRIAYSPTGLGEA